MITNFLVQNIITILILPEYWNVLPTQEASDKEACPFSFFRCITPWFFVQPTLPDCWHTSPLGPTYGPWDSTFYTKWKWEEHYHDHLYSIPSFLYQYIYSVTINLGYKGYDLIKTDIRDNWIEMTLSVILVKTNAHFSILSVNRM